MSKADADMQRRKALEKANRVRTYRKNLKQEIKNGRVDPAALLDDPACASMRTLELLLLVPYVGRIRANRVLMRAGISPSRPIGQLTERQRNELFGITDVNREAA